MFKFVYKYTKKGEPVLNWKGVLVATLTYPLYTFVFGRFIVAPFFASMYRTQFPGEIDIEAFDLWWQANGTLLNASVYAITSIFLLLFFGRFLFAVVRHAVKNFNWMIFLAVPIGYLIVMIVGTIVSLEMAKMGLLKSANQEALESIVNYNKPLFLFTVIVMGPFVEEVIFRAAWFRPLWTKGWFAAIVAVILNVALFGLHHVWGPIRDGAGLTELWFILAYMNGALATIYCHVVSRSFTSSLLMHMTINAVASMFMIYGYPALI